MLLKGSTRRTDYFLIILTVRYKEFVVPISNSAIIEAMDFRKHHYKKNLSYVDCIGYTIAREMNVIFLTGVKQFEDMPNVKFVK